MSAPHAPVPRQVKDAAISLGPLFPPFASIPIGVIMVAGGIVFPIQEWKKAPNAPYAVLFAVCILAFLFIPRVGTLHVSADRGLLTFRHSLAGSIFRPRRRSIEVSLVPETTIVLGFWLEEGGFIQSGIKCVRRGEPEVVLLRDHMLSEAKAAAIQKALVGIPGVRVKPTTVDGDREVEWQIETERQSFSLSTLIGWMLPVLGFFAGLLSLDRQALLLMGVVSVLLYGLVLLYERTKRPAGGDNDERVFSALALGFGVLRFGLFFAVAALGGTAVR